MKKIWKIFAAAFFVLFTSVSFSSCDMLAAFLGDMLADAFEGEPDEWLEMTVTYDDGTLSCGNVNLAFFYTEVEKEGHSNNNTRLAEGSKIEPGLTIVCYGSFTVVDFLTLNGCYKTHISIEDGAKLIWGTIFNTSIPLRDLARDGRVTSGNGIVKGEKYGKWSVYHPEDGITIGDNQERVPAPLSNRDARTYHSNEEFKASPTTKDYSVDWDAALGKIGLSTRTVTKR